MIIREEINKTLAARLKRLLFTPVIIKRVGKNKLKVVDTQGTQKSSVGNTSPYADRYRRLHMADRMYGSFTAGEVRLAKLNFYQDYEAMDQDPIISSALDIYSHESTTTNYKGELLTITTEDDKLKEILYNLFYGILNIEHNLASWIRNTCKYGDFYLYLDLEDKIGVKNVLPVTPYLIKREEGLEPESPYGYRFIEDGSYNTTYVGSAMSRNGVYEAYEMAHFRLLQDTNYLPYGKSMIESARKIYKQLSLLEDAMMLVRIMRAPERRIFYIDVGNIPPTDVDAYIEEIKSTMHKTPYIDRTTGEYNLKYNLMNSLEDYYIPVRGNNGGDKIDTLPGLSSQGQIDDVEYIRKKMMAALKIPAAFLSYDEGVEGKSTLAAEDIRFARTIEAIQRTFVSELKKIAIIHLRIQGYKDSSLINFELSLNNPSIVFQRQQVDLLSEQMAVVQNMFETKLFSSQYIYENIFKLPTDDIEKLRKEILEDQKMKYRLSQLEIEGNDPIKTGQSFGTPGDIAILNKLDTGEDSPLDPDKKTKDKAEPQGRPPEKGSFGKHKDANGQDPTGGKELKKAMTGGKPDHKFKGKGALDTEAHKYLLQKLYTNIISKKSAITETFKPEPDETNHISFLDENNLDTY